MTRIEIYLIGAVMLILGAVAAGLYERHVGYQQAKIEAAVALAAANARAYDLTSKLAAASHQSDQALEDLRTQHAKELSDALSRVQPVIVRDCPAAGGKLSATAVPAGSAHDTAPDPAKLPVPVERDIGSALVMLAGQCQADRDKLTAWQDRQRLLDAAQSSER
jgi:hypothetical protein